MIIFLLFFFATISYSPISKLSGIGGGNRGGDWLGQNIILWDDDVPILWDDDVAMSYDGGS